MERIRAKVESLWFKMDETETGPEYEESMYEAMNSLNNASDFLLEAISHLQISDNS